MLNLGASLRRLHMLSLLVLAPLLLFRANGQGNDTAALQDFQKGVTQDPSGYISRTWHENSSDSSGCPSGWYGVSCSNGRVTGLHLGGLNLSGEIGGGTLGALSELSSLNLSSNSFSGSLPEDLGSLSALQEMDLSDNHFNGSVPSSLGNLQNLVNLTLAGNEFDGTLFNMFQNMTSLELLDLSKNSLSGAIPETLSLFPQLSTLNLSWNQLTGILPKSLGLLQQLRIFDLSHNKLSGSIDPAVLNLDKLIYVDFSSNDLSGALPWQQIGPTFFDIVHVNLSHNQLSGPLAPGNAVSLFANQLQILDVNSNQFSGELPSFQYAFALRVLKLQNNLFSGAVPPALIAADSSVLEEIDISRNNLSGKLGNITANNLRSLNLSSNLLSGVLPMKLGSCATLDLSTNLFSGDLSGMKSWPDTLEILDLSHNFLTGNLPNQTAQLLRLTLLNLSHNGLSGSIPYSFGLYQKLTALDLTANQLTGFIPTSFFHSRALTDLRLAHNLLNGSIVLDSSYSADSFPNQQTAPLAILAPLASIMYSPLVVLDLSWNDLNGSIPLEIGSLTTLEVVDLSKNELTGTISAQFSQLPNLQSLDLSFNQLRGELPSGLPLTLQALNVSYNHFSGHIPLNLQLKFPLSSFFPGNSDLSLTGGPLSPPNSNGPVSSTEGRKGKASAVKAGLIGGCAALAVLICIVGLFIYNKIVSRSRKKARTPEFLVINKEFDQEAAGITNSPHRPDPDHGHPSDMVAVPAATMRFSREQLLSPENKTSSDTKDIDNTEKIAQADSSPSRKSFTSFNPTLKQGETSSSAEPSTVLKVRSPDKLAGDLFLVDNSMTFTAEDLSRAPAEVLGRSSHGTSYKATLDNGHVLAVKWLREGLVKSKKDFTKQARKYTNIRHPNVMPLRGYYWGPREHEKLVVSDFVSSGSLAGRLSGRAGRNFLPLNWLERLRIASDIARGISYLHTEHRLPHGNLKATNVLLDGPDLDGRISDYGLHMLMTGSGTANQITNAGALGYRAPELANARMPKPSLKADVYAFGVILLELLTGKGAGDIIPASSGTVDLPDWVRLQVNDGRSSDCFDHTLESVDENEDYPKGLQEVLEIALKCLSSSTTRPNIKRVYEELVAIRPE